MRSFRAFGAKKVALRLCLGFIIKAFVPLGLPGKRPIKVRGRLACDVEANMGIRLLVSVWVGD